MTLRSTIAALLLVGAALLAQVLRNPASQSAHLVDDLPSELAARPKKGLGYMPGRLIKVGADGSLEIVIGNPTDCVRADGSAAPCEQASAGADVWGEVPAGTVNGSSAVFTVANIPVTGTVRIYRNGLRLSAGEDYTITGAAQFTFLPGAIPASGDLLLVDYRY